MSNKHKYGFGICPDKPTVRSQRFGELKFCGCEDHPHRIDLTCAQIRCQIGGMVLTPEQVWEVLNELADNNSH